MAEYEIEKVRLEYTFFLLWVDYWFCGADERYSKSFRAILSIAEGSLQIPSVRSSNSNKNNSYESALVSCLSSNSRTQKAFNSNKMKDPLKGLVLISIKWCPKSLVSTLSWSSFVPQNLFSDVSPAYGVELDDWRKWSACERSLSIWVSGAPSEDMRTTDFTAWRR